MIIPFNSHASLVADIATHRDRSDLINLWWLGQSGFLVEGARGLVGIDLYLSDSLTKKYAATDKPHIRMSRLAITPESVASLEPIAIACTHQHTDHMDAETLTPLAMATPEVKLVAPRAWRALAQERSGLAWESIAGIDDASEVATGPFRWIGAPSAHETVERDEHGYHRFLGFVLKIGDWTIYHSGDTILYDGMVERLRPFNIDVAILPINGRAPERRVAGNLWGREAAWLAKEIGAKLVIPCHYDMFEFNTATPDEFVAECERLGQPYRVLRLGERWSSDEVRG